MERINFGIVLLKLSSDDCIFYMIVKSCSFSLQSLINRTHAHQLL